MWLELLLVAGTLFLLLYYYVTKNFGHWRSLGVPHTPGYFPWGSVNYFSGRHNDDLTGDIHKKFPDDPYFGYFIFGKPVLGINDPNFLRQIMVKDFDHFPDRVDPELLNSFSGGGDLDKVETVT